MNLKESYTYQNFLEQMINAAVSNMNIKSFTTTTTEHHKLKEADPNGTDKITVIPKSTTAYTPMMVLDMLVKLLEEKDKISDAISKSKKQLEMDIDKSMYMNKIRQRAIRTLESMSKIENTENEVERTGYRLNSTSGSQEPFTYICKVKQEIDFDRNDVRKLIKKYKDMNRELSNKKDLLELTTQVDFTPVFDSDMSFDEIVEAFK